MKRAFRISVWRQLAMMTAGLAIAGFGVALTTAPGLGTSPISSLPYVWSLLPCAQTFFVPLTFGTTTFLVNILFVLGQWGILRRRFPTIQWGQLGVVLLFGLFIDLGMWIFGTWTPEAYPLRVAESLLGSAVLAVGIALQVHANLLFNPGEGLVKALCRLLPWRFATVKLAFDFSLVLAALALCLSTLHRVEGLREGTLLAAFAVGFCLRFTMPLLRPVRRLLLVRKPAR